MPFSSSSAARAATLSPAADPEQLARSSDSDDRARVSERCMTAMMSECAGDANGPADSAAPRIVAGVDEAGRGPLAGPVVAAAVVLCRPRPAGLDDSKKLT